MNRPIRPYVQMTIDAVDVVIADLEERYDPDHFDRYETFESARDAALTSVEVMLDERDYDDEDHRKDLEEIQTLLEAAQSYEELAAQPGYARFLKLPGKVRSAA